IGETDLLAQRLVNVEAELTDLVVASVGRIIHGFSDDEKARSLIRSALQRMQREKNIRLCVAPGRFQDVRAIVDSLLREFPGKELIDVYEDETLEPPRIVVESDLGRVDIDLERGIDKLRMLLRGGSSIKEDGRNG